jgi:hypothetical protein
METRKDTFTAIDCKRFWFRNICFLFLFEIFFICPFLFFIVYTDQV